MAAVTNGGVKLKRLRFTCGDDIILLIEVVNINPYAHGPLICWPVICANVCRQLNKNFSTRAVKERVELLLNQFESGDRTNLRKRGTEDQYLEKESLLREVRDMIEEAKKYPNLKKKDFDISKYSNEEAIAARDAACEEMARAKAAKERLTNLRTVLIRSVKSVPGSSDFKESKSYYLTNAMQFAVPLKTLNADQSDGQQQVLLGDIEMEDISSLNEASSSLTSLLLSPSDITASTAQNSPTMIYVKSEPIDSSASEAEASLDNDAAHDTIVAQSEAKKAKTVTIHDAPARDRIVVQSEAKKARTIAVDDDAAHDRIMVPSEAKKAKTVEIHDAPAHDRIVVQSAVKTAKNIGIDDGAAHDTIAVQSAAKNTKSITNECQNCHKNQSERKEATKHFLLSLLPELDEMSDQQVKIFKRRTLRSIDDIMRQS